ncbi:MAG: lytic transglycosylase domain-containing protein [Desulforhopalus sp.]
MRNRRPLLPLLLTAFLLCSFVCSATEGYSSLHQSVRKYSNSVVSPEAIRKLSPFDHLIQYFSGISYFAPRHKVSPDFIRALILAESGANPVAVSSKNALGLGQIMLSTGRQAALELAESTTHFHYVSRKTLQDLQKDDLFDPAVNILLTCYLVAKYNHKFDGKLDLVVSAWNAGENTSSLRYGRHAPYKETENLIGKINGYYVYLLKNPGLR